MITLGIDIGTTHITATALDINSGAIVDSGCMPNKRLTSKHLYSYIQDPHEIEKTVRLLIERLQHPFEAMVITGQVHGLLYYDINGRAVSPLYTWLDRRAAHILTNGKTSQELLQEASGFLIPAGYTLANHYANRLLNEIPPEATGWTGILEYISARLTGASLLQTDSSCLASFGGFDPITSCFNKEVLDVVFKDSSFPIPQSAPPFGVAGHLKTGELLGYPIGDNQAGFFGTVAHPASSCLVSIGTSGQLSLFNREATVPSSMELRPYLGLGYLQVGATLSAGKSYEVVQRFIQSILSYSSQEQWTDRKVYDLMEDIAATQEVFPSPLQFSTAFNGTRENAQTRGSIKNISLDNLTLPNLVTGVAEGIVQELFSFSKALGTQFDNVERIIGVGSTIRKGPLFQKTLERTFKLPLEVVQTDAGAGIGAALKAGVTSGALKIEAIPSLIESIIRSKD